MLRLLVLLCASVSIASSSSKRHNGDLHKSKQYLDTLLWAVIISPESDITTKTKQNAVYAVVEYLLHLFNIYPSDRKVTNNVANAVAQDLGLINKGPISKLPNHFLFEHHYHDKSVDTLHQLQNKERSTFTLPKHEHFKHNLHKEHGISHLVWTEVQKNIEEKLEQHPQITWFSQQSFRPRNKRNQIEPLKLHFDDPVYSKQWHLKNHNYHGFDINVTGVWEYGITGKGITAVVVDDGLEWTNPDIVDNYRADGSYDLNDKDHDPMPSGSSEKNHHGTRCAGEIAAVKNSVCGVGVAYEAGIAGLRVLDGPMTDSLEADAFMSKLEVNHVFSCSWGPDDDGRTVDGPHYLATRGLQHGVDYGRGGYGALYVVASGNGGQFGDNCNFDGYANSVYTLTIGAVDERNEMPYYAEQCASMLAVTYSSGSGGPRARNIVTTDWLRHGATGCTDSHTGTSAAAPLAAAMVTLMLSARPCLSWRDVHYIIIMAANKVDVDVAHWHTNAAGLHHSHRHGFGLMDAWNLVNAAKAWQSVPWPTTFMTETLQENKPISRHLELTYTVSEETLTGYDLFTLEYIQVTVTLSHLRRGDIEIRLQCPSNTESIMAATRPHDDSGEGFREWTFSTVRCWGEEPLGTYVLLVSDKGAANAFGSGEFKSWRLTLYGTPMTSKDIQDRIRLVRESASGYYLKENITLPCPPPPVRPPPYSPVSQKILKILVLSGGFCIFLAIYETFEYLFCYDDEKKLHRRLFKLSLRARQLATSSQPTPQTPEAQALLNDQSDDAIQMDVLSTNQNREYSEISSSERRDDSEVEEGQPLVPADSSHSPAEQCQRIAQQFIKGLGTQNNNKEDEQERSS